MLKIEKQEYKPLVERTEIIATISSAPTPKKTEVQEKLAELLKKEKELVIVKHVYQEFGKREAKIIAYVYDSPDALKKFEKIKKKEIKEGNA